MEHHRQLLHHACGRSISCAFGEAASWPVEAMVDKFRDELLSETSDANAEEAANAEREAQERYLSSA